MDALLRRLARTGLRRGFSGEHWSWLLLAAAAFLFRRARAAEEPSTVLELAPGERYLVRLVHPDGRRRRRGDRRRWTAAAGSLDDLVATALEGADLGGESVAAGRGASAAPAGPSAPSDD